MESTKDDKYAIKKKVMDAGRQLGLSFVDDYSRLVFLMFNTVKIRAALDPHANFIDATKDYSGDIKQQSSNAISQATAVYQGNKEMIDSFPFVQEFCDEIEKYGQGHFRVGVFHKNVSFELDVFGNDLGIIYRQIIDGKA